jgi:exodeoxyribonuclease-3
MPNVKLATWNVNSIKARLPNLLAWLKSFQPDIVLLQETKCADEAFPRLEIEDMGYNVAVHGQKTYNGVAILSKTRLDDIVCGLPGDHTDDHARYIEATAFGKLRVVSLYLPNGNPIGTPKFSYKLSWMDRLKAQMKQALEGEEMIVFGGDYNVIQKDDDVFNPRAFANDALMQPETRTRFRSMLYLGMTDALRAFHSEPHLYSYWDYQAGAWQRDQGLLIDHLLLTPQAADTLLASGIDKEPRGKEKASDHTPVWCELTI